MIRNSKEFPNIAYRRGASGTLSPILLGTGIRVQTIVIASQNMTQAEIANDYDLTEVQVREVLRFYKAHRKDIDTQIRAEAALEPKA